MRERQLHDHRYKAMNSFFTLYKGSLYKKLQKLFIAKKKCTTSTYLKTSIDQHYISHIIN